MSDCHVQINGVSFCRAPRNVYDCVSHETAKALGVRLTCAQETHEKGEAFATLLREHLPVGTVVTVVDGPCDQRDDVGEFDYPNE